MDRSWARLLARRLDRSLRAVPTVEVNVLVFARGRLLRCALRCRALRGRNGLPSRNRGERQRRERRCQANKMPSQFVLVLSTSAPFSTRTWLAGRPTSAVRHAKSLSSLFHVRMHDRPVREDNSVDTPDSCAISGHRCQDYRNLITGFEGLGVETKID